MRRSLVAAAVVTLMLTAGGSTGSGTKASAAPTTTETQSADAQRMISMYSDVNDAFARNPDAGVRAIIASQYPEDRADVGFGRCVSANLPWGEDPAALKEDALCPEYPHDDADPGNTLTSDLVKKLHPKGRIYVTDVMITDGRKPTVHQRHQVILDGKAYQFSMC